MSEDSTRELLEYVNTHPEEACEHAEDCLFAAWFFRTFEAYRQHLLDEEFKSLTNDMEVT